MPRPLRAVVGVRSWSSEPPETEVHRLHLARQKPCETDHAASKNPRPRAQQLGARGRLLASALSSTAGLSDSNWLGGFRQVLRCRLSGNSVTSWPKRKRARMVHRAA